MAGAPDPVKQAYQRAVAGDRHAKVEVDRYVESLVSNLDLGLDPSDLALASNCISSIHVRVQLEVAAGNYDLARDWLQRTVDVGAIGGAPLEADALISVAPDVFEPSERSGRYWLRDPSAVIVSPDQDRAALALQRAGLRFMFVTDDGRVLDEQELNNTDHPYTPNYVSMVYRTPAGPSLYADTKGELASRWD